jgi:hypothetical protein
MEILANGRQVKIKVKSMFIIFFHIKSILHEQFNLEVQIVNSTYYVTFLETVKMCENFALNFGDKRTGFSFLFFIIIIILFSHYGIFFTKKGNNMTVLPHPPYFSLFPRLKIKLKGIIWTQLPLSLQLCQNDRGRITGDHEHPHRTRLPGSI